MNKKVEDVQCTLKSYNFECSYIRCFFMCQLFEFEHSIWNKIKQKKKHTITTHKVLFIFKWINKYTVFLIFAKLLLHQFIDLKIDLKPVSELII